MNEQWHVMSNADVVRVLKTDVERGLTRPRRRPAGSPRPQRAGRARRQEPLAHPVGAVHGHHGADPDRRRGGLARARRVPRGRRHPRHRGALRPARLLPGIPRRAGHGRAQEAGGARRARAARRPAVGHLGPRAGPRRHRAARGRQRRPGGRAPREAVNLRIQEAALTGESEAVEKATSRVMPAADAARWATAATWPTWAPSSPTGAAQAWSSATGMHTELGNIAALLQAVDDASRRRCSAAWTRSASCWPSSACVVGAILVAVIGLLRGEALLDMFLARRQRRRGRGARRAARRGHHHPGPGRPAHAQAATR